MSSSPLLTETLATLAQHIKRWGSALGFQHVGITDAGTSIRWNDAVDAAPSFAAWLAAGYHGEMAYLARDVSHRLNPSALLPNAQRVIMVRMGYWTTPVAEAQALLRQPGQAYLSRYAVGRDYHKVLRKRLHRLGEWMTAAVGPFGYRVCVDSAPLLEKALAAKAGLGWIGKHSLLVDRRAGSGFFLGGMVVDIPLPIDTPTAAHCGTCTACMDACPTRAIVAPYQVDARRCIAYQTIVHSGPIPSEFHQPISNRVYGCDDCQLVCPWQQRAPLNTEPDFHVRPVWQQPALHTLSAWDEGTFLRHTEGSAIRRIGYARWARNVGIAVKNVANKP